MTPNQLRALELQESKRHNEALEDTEKYKAKTEKYKAKTARRKAIADVVTGVVSNFIPSTSLRFSKILGSKSKSDSDDHNRTEKPKTPRYYRNKEVK